MVDWYIILFRLLDDHFLEFLLLVQSGGFFQERFNLRVTEHFLGVVGLIDVVKLQSCAEFVIIGLLLAESSRNSILLLLIRALNQCNRRIIYFGYVIKVRSRRRILLVLLLSLDRHNLLLLL